MQILNYYNWPVSFSMPPSRIELLHADMPNSDLGNLACKESTFEETLFRTKFSVGQLLLIFFFFI